MTRTVLDLPPTPRRRAPRPWLLLVAVAVAVAVTGPVLSSPRTVEAPAGSPASSAGSARLRSESMAVGEPAPAPQLGTAAPPGGPVAAPGGAAPVEFAPIVAQIPRLRLPGVAAELALDQVLGVEGVTHAAALEVGEVPVTGAQGPTTLTVAAVDPAEFRVLTPQVTADEAGVWQRLVEGDAAFTHDAGHRVDVAVGASVAAAGSAVLRVGAYASNGVPPVADALVSEATAAQLGLDGRQEILVALAEGADAEAIARQLAEISGVQAQVLEDPQPRRAFLTGAESGDEFEPYDYIDSGDGLIQIDPDWVARNIVRERVPILGGEVVCHRLMVAQLRGALQEVADRGLAHLIDPGQYGGCWVPRHIDWNPSKALSMHSWGLAVDLNVSTNGLGQPPQMDPRVVEIFDRWGFVWGGRWTRPDGMHFELGAVLDTPQS